MAKLEILEAEIKEWLGTGSLNLFGIPFSGKDTHGERLVPVLGAPPLISGCELSREASKGDMPADVRAIMDSGGLIPTEEFVKIVFPVLSRDEFMGKPLVLSCVGRKAGEQHGVREVLDSANHPLKAVVYLAMRDEQAAFDRLAADPTRIRPEDTPEGLATRIAVFKEETIPVVDYYRDVGMLLEVDGNLDKTTAYVSVVHEVHEFALAN